ncbi:MAG: flagellar export chaperone FlgN [Desulfovibrio sp.]
MINIIKANITRQEKGLLLMKMLLMEEFSRLEDRNPEGVTRIEFSLQELIRQLAAERASLRRLVPRIDPAAERLRDLYPILDEETVAYFKASLKSLDKMEQQCAVQAAKNQTMVRGLYETTTSMLDFLHNEIKPKPQNAYGANGKFIQKSENQPRLVRGRL